LLEKESSNGKTDNKEGNAEAAEMIKAKNGL
jgi:hypothetical protein